MLRSLETVAWIAAACLLGLFVLGYFIPGIGARTTWSMSAGLGVAFAAFVLNRINRMRALRG